MPPVKIRLVAACALITLAATGCGSSASGGSAKDGSSSSPSAGSPSTSASSSATGTSASDPLVKTLQALQVRAAKPGGGLFTEVTRKPSGEEISSIRGRYSLDDEQVAATFRVPDTSTGQKATAKLAIVGQDAFLQVDQWQKPSRGCWLKTTSKGLSERYGLDVADSDETPLPLTLLGAFTPEGSEGKGLIRGKLDLIAAIPLLSGSIKAQLLQARPSGSVAAFVTYDATHVLITVPGYALSTALSTSLKVDESKFSSITAARYEAGLTTLEGGFAKVAAPAASRQMSAADLKANRCG